MAAEFITPTEEQALIANLDAADLSPFRFQGWTGKRLTASFGWSYDFDNGKFGPTDAIPDWLLPVPPGPPRRSRSTHSLLWCP